MTFDSIEFLIFFGIVYTVWLLLQNAQKTLRNTFLLLASYVFYGYWSPPFVLLLLLSTFVDFYLAKAIAAADDDKRKKQLVGISVAINLSILGFFKYFNFFIDSAFMFIPPDAAVRPALEVILPVGISFYTFQSMSYSIDVYRGSLKPSKTIIDFALYVAFFPQLVAGPIERAGSMLPQFANKPRIEFDRAIEGLDLCVRGFFKKIVIADNVAPMVNLVFGDVDSASTLSLWVACYAFGIQVYADFSAYTDIARGSAKILGFELMENFNFPYRSLNISEFWRRWHISLSTWLRDYLYIPLGGNQGSKLMQLRNVFLVMALGGLWHGAAWNFVLWGIYHGSLLVIYHVSAPHIKSATASFGPMAKRIFTVLSWVLTFHLVTISWVMFRGQSVADIGTMLNKMLLHPFADGSLLSLTVINDTTRFEQAFYVALIAIAVVAQFQWQRIRDMGWFRTAQFRGGRVGASLLLIALLYPAVKEQFIYFQF